MHLAQKKIKQVLFLIFQNHTLSSSAENFYFYSFLFNILIIIAYKKFADLTFLVEPVGHDQITLSRHMHCTTASATLDDVSDVKNTVTPGVTVLFCRATGSGMTKTKPLKNHNSLIRRWMKMKFI
jgi:hypothetical protein